CMGVQALLLEISGGNFRCAYTAIPDEMKEILKHLSMLQAGEAAEHVVQPSASAGPGLRAGP
ncbi:MAG: hypothetical protein ACRESV_07830, partial [Nevskiales bacterium]